MSYSIYIGEAVTECYRDDDDELVAKWVVNEMDLENAPTFPNDEMTGKGNHRHPSYSGWAEFCQEAGLYDFFFEQWDGLMSPHPGIKIIKEDHYQQIKQALDARKESATLPPGFAGFPKLNPITRRLESEDEGKRDHILARLIWLEFWFRWALDNCENPAIQNT